MNGSNPLDRSAVHPEAYPIVEKIAQKNERQVIQVVGDIGFLKKLAANDYVDDKFGLPTVTDILKELEKPGRDPRPEFKTAEFKEGVETMDDLKPGMILEGVVTNVTNFGAFVDIGVHQDGLVHISLLSNTYVADPREVVKAGDIVQVKVIEIDLPRKRISLSMKLDEAAGEKIDGKRPTTNKFGKHVESKGGSNKSFGGKPAGKGPANAPGKSGTFADLFANARSLKDKK